MLNLAFPKRNRLLKRSQFQRVKRHAQHRLAGKFLLVDLCNGRRGRTRLGITVTRRYGKAVLRNRAKRLIRESFRQLKSQLPTGCDIHIRPRRALQVAKQPQVEAELLQLIKSATL